MLNKSQGKMFDDGTLTPSDARVSVLVPYPVDKAYDYAVPDGEHLEPGDYVVVPLGGREVSAVVWGEAAGDVDPAKVKAIVTKHKAKPMPKAVRDFIDWVADYTMTPKGFVLKMALSVPAGLDPEKPKRGYQICSSLRAERSNLSDMGHEVAASASPPRNDITLKQRTVLDVLSDGVPRIAAEVARDAGVGAGVVKGLVGKGLVEEVEIFNPAPCKKPNPFRAGFDLSEDQREVADILMSYISPPQSPPACGGEASAGGRGGEWL